jgi:hypothetical protein
MIKLYNSSGVLVASDDNSATDGRNAQLSYSVPTAGAYYIEIAPSTTNPTSNGEYLLTISFPPPPPQLAINNVSRTEGNSGTTAFTFTVTRSNDTSGVVTVDYATSDGTATAAGNDYSPTSGTLTFQSGDTQKTITVLVNGDVAEEDPESFFVQLSNPSPGVLLGGDGRGSGTILNDDTTVALGNDVAIVEGDTGSQSAVFTVNLSKPSALTVPVNYATANGTATTAGGDYVAASGTLTFAPGETSKTLAVTVNGDTAVEPNETFFVNLSSPANAVEVGVIARQLRQAIGLHHGHDQAVVRQQADLLAQGRGRGEQRWRDRQHPDVALQDTVNGLPEGGQLLHRSGMGPQAVADAREGPAKQDARLDGHQPVGDLAEHLGRSKASKLRVRDPLQQVRTR